MAKKSVRYHVRTTAGIAQEMARYEGGKVVSSLTLRREEERDFILKILQDEGEEEAGKWRDYDHVIESPYLNEKRWLSFGFALPEAVKKYAHDRDLRLKTLTILPDKALTPPPAPSPKHTSTMRQVDGEWIDLAGSEAWDVNEA